MDLRWYDGFFEGIVLDMWGAAVPREQTLVEVDALERVLGAAKGARVLDVACGLGRHAIEMAERGFRVTGVDLSAECLDRARIAASDRRARVDWIRADMKELPRGPFDAAYALGNTFGYLEPGGTRAYFRSLARALAPGARFVMDTGGLAESVLPNLRAREETTIGDVLFVEENRYDAASSVLETTYAFVRGSERRTRVGLQWVHTLRETKELLREAGLEVEHAWSSFDGTPFRVADRYAVIVAVRR